MSAAYRGGYIDTFCIVYDFDRVFFIFYLAFIFEYTVDTQYNCVVRVPVVEGTKGLLYLLSVCDLTVICVLPG